MTYARSFLSIESLPLCFSQLSLVIIFDTKDLLHSTKSNVVAICLYFTYFNSIENWLLEDAALTDFYKKHLFTI